MISFAHPYILYLLLLVPAIVVLHAVARYSRRRRMARFGKPAILASLMPDASRYTPGLKLVLQLFAITAIIIVLARPRAGQNRR